MLAKLNLRNESAERLLILPLSVIDVRNLLSQRGTRQGGPRGVYKVLFRLQEFPEVWSITRLGLVRAASTPGASLLCVHEQ